MTALKARGGILWHLSPSSQTMDSSPTSNGKLGGASLLPSVPRLDSTLGAVLLGTYFGLMQVDVLRNEKVRISDGSLILYGLVLHQAFRYFRLFKKDVLVIRTFVR